MISVTVAPDAPNSARKGLQESGIGSRRRVQESDAPWRARVQRLMMVEYKRVTVY